MDDEDGNAIDLDLLIDDLKNEHKKAEAEMSRAVVEGGGKRRKVVFQFCTTDDSEPLINSLEPFVRDSLLAMNPEDRIDNLNGYLNELFERLSEEHQTWVKTFTTYNDRFKALMQCLNAN
jgi:hypothetical protein